MKIAARITVGCFVLVSVLMRTAPAINLYSLRSPNEEYQSYFGYSACWAGDVNNDGYHDVIVGAPGEDIASQDRVGRAYVINGHTGGVIWTLTSTNQEWGGQFGDAVSWAGDVNNDGYYDVIVGAPLEDNNPTYDDAGRAYVFSGLTGGLIHSLVSPNAEDYGYFGMSVSSAGDVNNDGYDDVIVGAYKETVGGSNYGAGRAYVFNGNTGGLLRTLVSPNAQVQGQFGISVAAATDVNGDYYDDVVVGANWETGSGGQGSAGRAYVFSGQTGTVLQTMTSPTQQWYGYFGQSVSGVGQNMVIIGAPQESPGASPDSAGRAHVFNGATGAHLRTLSSPREQLNGNFGSAVSWAGDVDGYGTYDVLVGAPRESLDVATPEAGWAYVFAGEDGSDLYWFASPYAEPYGWFGSSLSGASDTDNDGNVDVVIGAYLEDPGSSPQDAGRAYLMSPFNYQIDLSGWKDQGVLWLQWVPFGPAWEYHIYGAGNNPYFPPEPWTMLDEVTPGTTTWSSPNGMGDPDLNYTYMVIAVNAYGEEVVRSNYFGQFDFGTGTSP